MSAARLSFLVTAIRRFLYRTGLGIHALRQISVQKRFLCWFPGRGARFVFTWNVPNKYDIERLL
jgi:hypothetical protein